MHEIVTIQLGQRSNYLGTHFWNIQESYFTYSEHERSIIDHDVHFRPGLGNDNSETFTPRAVIYDLKGGFGTLRKYNALYGIQDESNPAQGLWEGATLIQNEPTIELSEYQKKLEGGLPTPQLRASDVRYWSDFNRVYFHPRSIVQLNDYELNSELMPFENWSNGEDLFQNLDREFDLIDRDIRPFVEECDQMQGFQLLTGVDDAWGGFAAKYLDNLRDEYGKTSIWVWGLEDQSRVVRQKQQLRSCNSARSLRSLGQQASAFIRLAAPPANLPNYVNLLDNSDWATTALLSAGLESSTLPTRFNATTRKRGSLTLFEDILNTNGNQKLFELHASVNNFSKGSGGQPNGNDRILNGGGNPGVHTDPMPSPLDIDYSPSSNAILASRSFHVFGQVESERDRLESNLRTSSLAPEDRLRRRLNKESVVEIFQTDLQYPILDTFPERLFQTQRQDQGALDITAALVCTSATKNKVIDLRDATFRLVQIDERESLYNDLTEVAQNYSIGWESGSDTGNDDD
ncbi:uncharacterized protein A1O9_04128 [Exophiala aquamarina CBS 119918]|uniref:Protein DML1 n=1 Tax=Exophiala aquamarina CBS 119918 TaxID=1182545 RepID=A0A072PGS4_9EURO|nr:uncharacterized protein A1O9_04128 [Exophiala aquamarina CBS 119918]KEF59284.1 hypothetical protein A1O9_04128 [Exophiala aquamarina CBS 119918]